MATTSKPTALKKTSDAAAVAVSAAHSTGTLGANIDAMWALREEKRAADAVVKIVEAKIKELEVTMFELLDAQETTKSQGKKASVSITETVVGTVEDWDAFWPYIAKNKFWHLVQKRVSDPGLRELWAMQKKTPGVTPFTKRTLNVRSLSV